MHVPTKSIWLKRRKIVLPQTVASLMIPTLELPYLAFLFLPRPSIPDHCLSFYLYIKARIFEKRSPKLIPTPSTWAEPMRFPFKTTRRQQQF